MTKHSTRIFYAGTLLLMLAACMSMAADEPKQTEQTFEGEISLKVGYRYLLALPKGYEEEPTKQWPLVVFLHGSGERGSDLNEVKRHGPPKLVEAGKVLGAIIASPQVPAGLVWNPHGVKALTDELAKTLRVDRQRIYLTGMSMGGFGTWDTAFEYPDLYAALMPVCGGAGVKFILADRIKHVPAWIFHGAKDTAVPVSFSETIFRALNAKGAPVKLTIYPEAKHDSWTETYDNPEAWEWLLSQRRKEE